MSGSVNKAILIGNVIADPEIRTTQGGKKIANIRVATNETWKDRSTGERREKAEFHRVVVFNEQLAKIVEQYVKKGSKLYVEGALQTRKWTDNSGAEKYSTEVVLQNVNGSITLLGDPPGEDRRSEQKSQDRVPDRAPGERDANGKRPFDDRVYDDEIPF